MATVRLLQQSRENIEVLKCIFPNLKDDLELNTTLRALEGLLITQNRETWFDYKKILYIKAVDLNYEGQLNTKYEVGKIYENVYFCDNPNSICDYPKYENPLNCRYLEVNPLTMYLPFENELHSYKGNVKIIREIPIKELLEYTGFSEKYNYFNNNLQIEQENIKKTKELMKNLIIYIPLGIIIMFIISKII